MRDDFYRVFPVSPDLAPFVKRYLHADCLARATVRVSPNACVYLGHVFNGGDVRTEVGGAPQRYSSGWHVWGPMRDTRLMVRYRGHIGHLLVEFTTTGFFRLLRCPAARITSRSMELDRFDTSLAAAFCQAAGTAESLEARLRGVETVLREKMATALPDIPPVAAAAEALEQQAGMLRVAALCGELGLSARQLNRLFTAIVGVPPKYFAQICQIRRAASLLGRPGGDALSAIALDCGFYDQAHFIKAMQRFFGEVPGSYRRAAIAAAPSP